MQFGRGLNGIPHNNMQNQMPPPVLHPVDEYNRRLGNGFTFMFVFYISVYSGIFIVIN